MKNQLITNGKSITIFSSFSNEWCLIPTVSVHFCPHCSIICFFFLNFFAGIKSEPAKKKD